LRRKAAPAFFIELQIIRDGPNFRKLAASARVELLHRFSGVFCREWLLQQDGILPRIFSLMRARSGSSSSAIKTVPL
jgi:hypothetical protein